MKSALRNVIKPGGQDGRAKCNKIGLAGLLLCDHIDPLHLGQFSSPLRSLRSTNSTRIRTENSLSSKVDCRRSTKLRPRTCVRPLLLADLPKNTTYSYNVDIGLSNETAAHQTVRQRIVFRKVELKNGLMTVKDVRTHLGRTNRHEHHPQFGRPVPLGFAKRDPILIKRLNFNVPRCSHQPITQIDWV